MKIKTVSRTISFGTYENISMCAEVGNNETPREVVTRLEKEIGEIISKKDLYNNLDIEVTNLENRKRYLENDIENMEKRQKELIDWAKEHNISDHAFSELPF